MTAFIRKTIICLLLSISTGFAAEGVQQFPPPAKGMIRFVLPLPYQDDESLFRLELIVGKTVRTDAQNNYSFSGTIEKGGDPDWNFSYYRVSELGQMTGEIMTVEADTPLVDRFVALGGGPYFIRYNSRLPVVVYVPEGAEVRYRLWSAGPEIRILGEG